MSESSDDRRSLRGASFWLLVAFLALSALAGRLAYLAKPFDHDARMFIYLGKLADEGGRFCHDIIDNKFPSVGLITSVFWKSLGTWWPGYVLAQTALAIAGALLLGRMARRYFGAHARLPATLFALVYLNFNVAVFGGFQLETLHAFFAILAAGAALEALRAEGHLSGLADAFVVGLAAGCAAMVKPNGLAVLGAFALATCAVHWRDWRRLIACGFASLLGLSVPIGATLLYLVQIDILRDMPALYQQISQYAKETPWETSDYFKPLVVLVVALFPMIVRAWVFRKDRIAATLPAAGVIFAATWLVLELLGAMMQSRMYAYHFLVVAPPAALLYAMWPRRPRVASLASALVPLAIGSILAAGEIVAFYHPSPARSPLSDYLAKRTEPGDAIWVDSMPRVLLETDLRPGARIPLTFLFLNHDTAPLEYSQIMLDDFEQRRPRYIVLPLALEDKLSYESKQAPELFNRPARRENYRLAWQRIVQYVEQNYEFEKWLDGNMIYRRKSPIEIATVQDSLD